MTEPAEASARPSSMRWRKPSAPRLDPDQARRQGDITRTAFLHLGRDAAIAFLNAPHSGLGGRPLDLATASDLGRNSVEDEIDRIATGAKQARRDRP